MSKNPTKFVLRWGVVGLGNFAAKYISDVFKYYHEDTEYGDQIEHQLHAVVSSSSIEKAKSFVKLLDTNITGVPKLYTSYEEFLQDHCIDIVYIASPNSTHYPLALRALNAGKHIIVEKTFTLSSTQAQKLRETGHEKGLFILDGVWTKFLPSFQKLQKVILEEGILGKITRVTADLSHDCEYNKTSRLFDAALGGGVLYDNLIYSLNWVDSLLSSQTKTPPTVNSWSILQNEEPWLDITTGINLIYQDLGAVGTATGSFEVESPKYSVLIEGKKGHIRIDKASKPSEAILFTSSHVNGVSIDLPSFKGNGYYFEANIAAISIRDKLLEPKNSPLDNSIRVLNIFDTVKLQNGIKFPEELENIHQSK